MNNKYKISIPSNTVSSVIDGSDFAARPFELGCYDDDDDDESAAADGSLSFNIVHCSAR